MQTISSQDPSQNDQIMNLDPERALPSTGSEKGDVMAYASDMYKALQLSRQREAALQQQLAHSQNVSKEMGAASLYQYKEAAEKSLEKARLLKKAAMEAGNSEDILKADEEYMAAITAKNWSEQMIRQKEAGKNQGTGDQDATSSRGSPSTETGMDPRAAAFMKSHPLIDALNPSYDAEKHREVATYAMALEMNLQNEGRAHEICSPQYFKKIEDYMTARFGAPSGHSSSSTSSKTDSTKPAVKPLSPDEQRICKIMKIKEEDYLKHREECTREYQERLAAGERYA
jgi:hypothetical protein